MKYDFQNTIIGAGAVGLSIARELSQRGENVLVLEEGHSFGMGISSRNSEVIHCGAYYKPESLKAKHCLVGRELLYTYCKEKQIKHKRIGKLIVATSESERIQLLEILNRSKSNGLLNYDKLSILSQKEVAQISSKLHCVEALYSPSSGVFDTYGFLQNLLWDAATNGVTFAYNTRVDNIEPTDAITITGMSAGEYVKVSTRNLIIAAGIHTQKISIAANLPTPSGYWVKGNYFQLRDRAPFEHLIYPVPSTDGLGIHLTIDMDGRAKFGPDTQLTHYENYSVDPSLVNQFEEAIRKYWPSLPNNSLMPSYAGIRPKLYVQPGEEPDFEIYTPKETGIEGLFVLHGIESPGLTASLSLAREVYQAIANEK